MPIGQVRAFALRVSIQGGSEARDWPLLCLGRRGLFALLCTACCCRRLLLSLLEAWVGRPLLLVKQSFLGTVGTIGALGQTSATMSQQCSSPANQKHQRVEAAPAISSRQAPGTGGKDPMRAGLHQALPGNLP